MSDALADEITNTPEWNREIADWRGLRRRQVQVIPFLLPGGYIDYALSVIFGGDTFSASMKGLFESAGSFSVARALGEPQAPPQVELGQCENQLRRRLIRMMTNDISPFVKRAGDIAMAKLGDIDEGTGFSDTLLRRLLASYRWLSEERLIETLRMARVESILDS